MLQTKFHVNPQGRVLPCGAKVKCDFADSPHFDNEEEAHDYAEHMAEHEAKEENENYTVKSKNNTENINQKLDSLYDSITSLSQHEGDFFMQRWLEEEREDYTALKNLREGLHKAGFDIKEFDGEYPIRITSKSGVEIIGERAITTSGRPYGNPTYIFTKEVEEASQNTQEAFNVLREHRENRHITSIAREADNTAREHEDILNEGVWPQTSTKLHEDDELYLEGTIEGYFEFVEAAKNKSPKDAIAELNAMAEKERNRLLEEKDEEESKRISGRFDAFNHTQRLHKGRIHNYYANRGFADYTQKAKQEEFILMKHLRNSSEILNNSEKNPKLAKNASYHRGQVAAVKHSLSNYKVDGNTVRQILKEEEIAQKEWVSKGALSRLVSNTLPSGSEDRQDFYEGYINAKKNLLRDLRFNNTGRTATEIHLASMKEGQKIRTDDGHNWKLTTGKKTKERIWQNTKTKKIESELGMLNKLAEDGYHFASD